MEIPLVAQAYAFKSLLSIDEMESRLNQAGPWVWSGRDSDTYGDYLVTRPYASCTKLRIVGDAGKFLLDIIFDPYHWDGTLVENHISAEELGRILLVQILPTVSAENVTEARPL